MSTQDFNLADLMEAIHGLHPASMTSEQLARALSAVKFAAPCWQDELRRRELAEMRRRELAEMRRRELAEVA